MITIGILDDVQLLKAEKNEHGTLVLSMDVVGNANDDEFDALNDKSDRSNDMGPRDFIIWPYKYDEYTKEPEDMLKQMVNMKSFLNHILKGYMTEDQIKWNAYEGLQWPAEKDQRMQMLKNEKVVAKIYDNQVSQFMRMITPHVGPDSPKFRVKFNRQSEHKNFPTLPNFAPFWESMDIPKDQSRLAYDRWDLGYRPGDEEGKPSKWSKADPKPSTNVPPPDNTSEGSEAEAAEVENIFGAENAKDLGI
jgi:hypothetical protein